MPTSIPCTRSTKHQSVSTQKIKLLCFHATRIVCIRCTKHQSVRTQRIALMCYTPWHMQTCTLHRGPVHLRRGQRVKQAIADGCSRMTWASPAGPLEGDRAPEYPRGVPDIPGACSPVPWTQMVPALVSIVSAAVPSDPCLTLSGMHQATRRPLIAVKGSIYVRKQEGMSRHKALRPTLTPGQQAAVFRPREAEAAAVASSAF